MPTTDPCFMPVHALAGEFAAGRLSPVALTEALLERIEAHDTKLHAFIAVYGEDARRAAEAAALAIRAGHAVGPLHGVLCPGSRPRQPGIPPVVHRQPGLTRDRRRRARART